MTADDTPWQKSVEASRAFLSRKVYGDAVYRTALDSIATRSVELPAPPDGDDDPSDRVVRFIEETTRTAVGYRGLSDGLTWLVSELLKEIERDQGISPTDMLDKIEGALHKRTAAGE